MVALTACDDRVESRFPDYAAIPEHSGIWSWLPLFFPTSASEIEITTHLDINLFYADFNLSEAGERSRFEAGYMKEAGRKDADIGQKCAYRMSKTHWNPDAQERPLFILKTGAQRYRISNDNAECGGFLLK